MPAALPSPVRAGSERLLDVRPVLAKGGDPFHLILRTIDELGADQALHLIVGFEPAPLFAVLRAQGFASHVQRDGEVVHVWFFRDGAGSGRPSAGPSPERGALQAPVEMDVRGLEPPQPMIAILERLVELGPGAQLLVRHHREPVLLYEKLALRGYAARANRRAEGDYVVHIAPAWVFEQAA